MTVRSDEKNVLDVGANPTISTKVESYYYSEHEWSKLIGWGSVPDYRARGMNSFDRAQSIQTDSPKGA